MPRKNTSVPLNLRHLRQKPRENLSSWHLLFCPLQLALLNFFAALFCAERTFSLSFAWAFCFKAHVDWFRKFETASARLLWERHCVSLYYALLRPSQSPFCLQRPLGIVSSYASPRNIFKFNSILIILPTNIKSISWELLKFATTKGIQIFK